MPVAFGGIPNRDLVCSLLAPICAFWHSSVDLGPHSIDFPLAPKRSGSLYFLVLEVGAVLHSPQACWTVAE